MALKPKALSPSPDTVAIRGLVFLAAREDDLLRFLAASGADPAELRSRTDDPVMMGAILDHLLAEDALLTAFCEEEGLTPQTVHLARHKLSNLPGDE